MVVMIPSNSPFTFLAPICIPYITIQYVNCPLPYFANGLGNQLCFVYTPCILRCHHTTMQHKTGKGRKGNVVDMVLLKAVLDMRVVTVRALLSII